MRSIALRSISLVGVALLLAVRSPALGAEPSLPAESPTPAATSTVQATGRFGGWFQVTVTDAGLGRLYVGVLGGEARHVASSGNGIHADGPVAGVVIADRQTADGHRIDLFDVVTGERTDLLTNPTPVGGAVLGAGAARAWWVAGEMGGPWALWSAPTTGDVSPELVLDGIAATAPVITPSVDRRQLVISDWWGGDEFLVYDTISGQVTTVPSADTSGVVGPFDGHVLAWPEGHGDERSLPLVAIGWDGSRRMVAEGNGSFAELYGTAAAPVLVWEVWAFEERDMVLYALDRLDGPVREIHRAHLPDGAPPGPGLVPVGATVGVEVPGWVTLAPDRTIYPPDRQQKMLLVNVSTGEIRTVGVDPLPDPPQSDGART